MRPASNPLDLNNLPEDYCSRDGKQVFEEGSSTSSGYGKKKSGGKDGKDECGKVYECRFCSLKFCKSQALGGHMNRHRQERETETLNRARQLVFNSDHNLAAQGGQLGCHPMAPGSYHPGGNIGDPYRSAVYPPRLFSVSSSTHLPPPPPQPPHQPYVYTSPSRLHPYPSQYPQQPMNDYYVGHVLNNMTSPQDSNSYTCIGAPIGHGGFGHASGHGSEGRSRDGSLMSHHHNNQDQEGLNWGRSYATAASAAGGGGAAGLQQRLDPTSSINLFQDGF